MVWGCSELLVAADWPDKSLINDLMYGFPLVGELPRSGSLPSCAYRPTCETRESLLQHAALRNVETLRRVSASAALDGEVVKEMDTKAAAEVSEGKARPVALDCAMAEGVVTPRFPADEGWKYKDSWRKRNVRCIDDFTASLINAATAAGESIHHDTLDILVALLHHFGAHGQQVRFRKDDFTGAYKTLPLRAEDLDLAIAVWRDSGGVLQAPRLLCCPFGAVASVHAWHRLGAAAQGILTTIFLIIYARYVDDLFALAAVVVDARVGVGSFVGPGGTARLARCVVEDLLGWELDPDKQVTDARICCTGRRSGV